MRQAHIASVSREDRMRTLAEDGWCVLIKLLYSREISDRGRYMLAAESDSVLVCA